MKKLLAEAVDWLEDDASRMYHDNLFERIERSAAGDTRPVCKKPLDAILDLIIRIRQRLDQKND